MPTPRLLARFLRDYPFQPATAYWRSIEVDCLLRRPLPDGRGLDLGCGDGLLTEIILEYGGKRQLIGVDPDPAETALARRLGIYAQVHTTGAEAIPEADGAFDWVLSNSVLEHIVDIHGTLDEVGRVLRPAGQFVFSVPGPDFHHALRGPWLRRHGRQKYLRDIDQRLAHRRYWSEADWSEQLASRGMRIEAAVTYLSRSQVRRWELISGATAGVLHSVYRKPPIEIQRSLGMRAFRRRMPGLLARVLAPLMSLGTRADSGVQGGLLITAVRDES